jgi:hypothetical protein
MVCPTWNGYFSIPKMDADGNPVPNEIDCKNRPTISAKKLIADLYLLHIHLALPHLIRLKLVKFLKQV